MKKATTVAKFQTRMFVLYKHQLVYKSKDGKQVDFVPNLSTSLKVRQGITLINIFLCDMSFIRTAQINYLNKSVYKMTVKLSQTRGSVSVMGIKICEDVDECSFNRPHVFQVHAQCTLISLLNKSAHLVLVYPISLLSLIRLTIFHVMF